MEEGFPFLPSGCQMVLDRVAREIILASIREQVSPRWAVLRDELRRYPGDRPPGPGLGTAPYIFLGPADYVSHTGDRPVAITWRLHRPAY